MIEQEIATLLSERMKQLAREALQEIMSDHASHVTVADEAAVRLRDQITLIKAKERITIKEAALLLSCSESHVRKLVRQARKGKSRRPIPFVDMEGVTVFPLCDLLDWASPQLPPQEVLNNHAIRNQSA